MTGLSVFHQLHCLNRIRKLLHPERYPWKLAPNLSELETHIHDNHCVDLIRQALMCNADISPIKWEMNAKLGIPLPSAKTVHTCKKWDSLMDWAADHKM
jgi:UDP-N-acetyl-D-mannosaminuronic acid transferase (WecB/TagA/CpsF family)